MNILRTILFSIALVLTGFCTFAQTDPYPEENETDVYSIIVKYQGQKPVINDFVNAWLSNPEDELSGVLYDMWRKYIKGKPLDKTEKVTLDSKNGFVSFEKVYPPEEYNGDGGKLLVEMCYWNSSDGNHKVFASSVQQFQGDKAIQTEFGGMSFGIYNNATHKMTYVNQYDMGVEVKTGMENIGVKVEDGKYFVNNNETGERTPITEEQFYKWLIEYPIVTYDLPREGKDITAVINNRPEGKKEIIVKWNGLRFDVQQ